MAPMVICPTSFSLPTQTYGLMSLAVIVVMLFMGAFFLRKFFHKMNHNE